jgi:hypothetical protein
VRAFAADVARGLAYLHGAAAVVHGDVKARNVVLGADGRAKLADFGCARRAGEGPIIGGTPAFMAPEVARGEAQGPAADVWALGCTVIELATGRAPWSRRVDDVVAAVRLIGYTDAVPDTPEWMSAEAKDFLAKCLCRDAADRWTAARLLEHPFLVCGGVKAEGVAMAKWVSPKSTLDAALWESDADDDLPETPADRIRSLAGPCSALPEWESDEGWIEVRSSRSGLSDSAAACQEVKFPTYGDMSDAAAVATSSEQACCGEVLDLPVATTAAETTHTGSIWGDGPVAEVEAAERFGADLDAADDDPVGAAGAYARRQQQDILEDFITVNDPIVLGLNVSDEGIANARFPGPFVSAARPLPLFVL